MNRPNPTPAHDQALGSIESRRVELRRMKRFATGLLVAMAVVFVVTRSLEDSVHWLSYVRAFSEAAMVGALADWFAVTALFRHPLGLPIPHTAIIAKRKNEIGQGLGEFVQQNFLTPTVLQEKVASVRPAARIGTWLGEEESADRVCSMVAKGARAFVDVLRDDEIQAAIEHVVRRRVDSMPAAPLAGKALEIARQEGRQKKAIDAVINRLNVVLQTNALVFRERLHQESPWWVPASVDDRVFAKLYSAVQRFVQEVAESPTHPIRRNIDEWVDETIARLHTDPEYRAKGEQLKAQLLDHPEFRGWIADMWTDSKRAFLEQLEQPDGELRLRLRQAVVEFGERLRTELPLQDRVDSLTARAVGTLAERYGHEAAEIIRSTVERWDTEETIDRIETQIGRDLQFIRVNGTVVGGLAGLVIYTVGQFL